MEPRTRIRTLRLLARLQGKPEYAKTLPLEIKPGEKGEKIVRIF